MHFTIYNFRSLKDFPCTKASQPKEIKHISRVELKSQLKPYDLFWSHRHRVGFPLFSEQSTDGLLVKVITCKEAFESDGEMKSTAYEGSLGDTFIESKSHVPCLC
ncbi:hypothetical protein HI914_07418 [Erysiphe necator]|nr:hypothetical protein HI914_07418 [Erysiphe necator]